MQGSIRSTFISLQRLHHGAHVNTKAVWFFNGTVSIQFTSSPALICLQRRLLISFSFCMGLSRLCFSQFFFQSTQISLWYYLAAKFVCNRVRMDRFQALGIFIYLFILLCQSSGGHHDAKWWPRGDVPRWPKGKASCKTVIITYCTPWIPVQIHIWHATNQGFHKQPPTQKLRQPQGIWKGQSWFCDFNHMVSELDLLETCENKARD